MVRTREGLTAKAVAWVVLLGIICRPGLGREVRLTIYPQKASAEAGEYSLLPLPASLTEGDAFPLYQKAIQALPAEKDRNQASKWLALSIEEFPVDQVQEVLQRSMEGLRGAARAVRCRDCNWPKLTDPAALTASVEEFRRLRVVVQLWAHYEIAQGGSEGALLALRTGFGLARHIGQGPSLLQLMVGVAAAGSMCREVEQFVQLEDAPNLYAALAALPKPFVDVEKVIEADKTTVVQLWPGVQMTREQIENQMKASYEQVRLLARRLERDVAALQCLEAIRSYAASHSGQLPPTLGEITEVPVPRNPLTGEPFRYTRTSAVAVLESAAGPGRDQKEGNRYEIMVKN
jgi:hypothetical protein